MIIDFKLSKSTGCKLQIAKKRFQCALNPSPTIVGAENPQKRASECVLVCIPSRLLTLLSAVWEISDALVDARSLSDFSDLTDCSDFSDSSICVVSLESPLSLGSSVTAVCRRDWNHTLKDWYWNISFRKAAGKPDYLAVLGRMLLMIRCIFVGLLLLRSLCAVYLEYINNLEREIMRERVGEREGEKEGERCYLLASPFSVLSFWLGQLEDPLRHFNDVLAKIRVTETRFYGQNYFTFYSLDKLNKIKKINSLTF